MRDVFSKTLIHADRSRFFLVRAASLGGWEVSEHEDHRIIVRHHYVDWHHVELAMMHYHLRIAQLIGEGWQEA
jgi:hypothetical protein